MSHPATPLKILLLIAVTFLPCGACTAIYRAYSGCPLLAGKGFSEVSAMDAEEIFAYFKGRQTERPACLKDSVQVTMESVYQKRNARMRATLCKPIQKYQRKHLEELLRSHGLSADMDALTQFDAIDIESCLGNNPFAEPPISQEKQQLLSQKLQATSLSASREIKCNLAPISLHACQDNSQTRRPGGHHFSML